MPPSLSARRLPVFICYAQADNAGEPRDRWLDRLMKHLRPLGEIAVFSDREIEAGTDWHGAISESLAAARAAVLLVSADFLSSRYIRSSELPVLLQRAKEGGVLILPVILQPCLFEEATFLYPDPHRGPERLSLASLQAVNPPDRPLSSLPHHEQEATLVRVARLLYQEVQRGPQQLSLPAPGERVGRYRLVRLLGQGGMGVVYAAEQEEAGPVALKFLRPELAADRELSTRFLDEARAAGRLFDPGVVKVFGCDRVQGGLPFLVMELLEGESLAARLRRAGGARPEALPLCWQVAAVLAAVHARGVVHRDLKPDNVMVVPDAASPLGERVKLLDFGVAKLSGELFGTAAGRERTRQGALLGTPLYMAPEQARDPGSATDRADVYSLGVMLYEVLSGRPPFEADSLMKLLEIYIERRPAPDLQERAPGVKPELAALVRRMVGYDAPARPTMAQVRDELQRLLQAEAAAQQERALAERIAEAERAAEERARQQGEQERQRAAEQAAGERAALERRAAEVAAARRAAEARVAALEQAAERAARERAAEKAAQEQAAAAEQARRQAEAEREERAEQARRQAEAEREERAEQARKQAEAKQAEQAQRWAEAQHAIEAELARRQAAERAQAERVAFVRAEEERNRAAQTADPKSWRRALPSIAGASLCAFLIGAVALLRLHGGPKKSDKPNTPIEAPVEAPAQTKGLAESPKTHAPLAPPAEPIPAPVRMMPIPEGRFIMGSKNGERDAQDDERPAHAVKVAAFLMDETEVTVEAYAACVKAGPCKAQDTVNWREYSADEVKLYNKVCNYGREERGDHPMNCVDHEQASAYCVWAGKRLPTEEEWEYAARGTDGRRYPWGNEEPSAVRLNACGSECVTWAKERGRNFSSMYSDPDGWATTAPVGRFPQGKGPFGLLDMAGNVWEWTDGNYCDGYDKKCANSALRVVRGGSWYSNRRSYVRAAYRYGNGPSNRLNYLGFRCARTAP